MKEKELYKGRRIIFLLKLLISYDIQPMHL